MIAVINAAFGIETFLEGTRIDEAGMAQMQRKGEFLVGENEPGSIIAAVYVELRGKRGYFGVLAVDPKCQHAGSGRAMIEAAEDYCREAGCRFIDLTVLSLRPELLPFYRRLGYVESGTEEFRPARPLRPGVECHCIVMSKAL